MDTTKPTENAGQHLPALFKRGAGEVELKVLCNKYEACVAVDWGNTENGHLRFSSAAALEAIDEPGWGKWSDGCQSGCFPNGAGDDGQGVCHVKQGGFSFSCPSHTEIVFASLPRERMRVYADQSFL